MGIRIALGLWHFARLDDPATDGGRGDVLITIFVIVALLIVVLLIGLGVTLARRPGKELDAAGDPTGTPPEAPPR